MDEGKRKNDLGELAAALFGELDRLDACRTAEEIEREVMRARAVKDIAATVIDNANTVISAVRLRQQAEDGQLGTLAPLPPLLLGDGE